MHLWQCQSPRREQWRKQFLITLGSKCRSSNTCPVLTSLLLGGIRSVFDDTAFQAEGSAEIEALAAEQDHLGWHQVLLGRFSKKWISAQSAYLHQREIPPTGFNHGTTWLCQLIHTIWNELKQLWTLRNEDRHGRDEESKLACKYNHTRRVTEWLYNLRDQCLPEDRDHMFYPSIQEHLQREQSEREMRDWIHLHKKAILASVDQFHQRASGRHSLPDPRRRQQSKTKYPWRA